MRRSRLARQGRRAANYRVRRERLRTHASARADPQNIRLDPQVLRLAPQKGACFCGSLWYGVHIEHAKKVNKMRSNDENGDNKNVINSEKINLRKLEFSPQKNPLFHVQDVKIKTKKVRTGATNELVDPGTGEIHTAVIHTIEPTDNEHFVKFFSAGIRASYELNLTGTKVFQAILQLYQNMPMSGGYADCIYIRFFDGGLDGCQLNMSEDTFNRGLKMLLQKGFLAPRQPNLYWVNPHLFFRGDRAVFIREYRRTSALPPDVADRAALEKRGQQRLVG